MLCCLLVSPKSLATTIWRVPPTSGVLSPVEPDGCHPHKSSHTRCVYQLCFTDEGFEAWEAIKYLWEITGLWDEVRTWTQLIMAITKYIFLPRLYQFLDACPQIHLPLLFILVLSSTDSKHIQKTNCAGWVRTICSFTKWRSCLYLMMYINSLIISHVQNELMY